MNKVVDLDRNRWIVIFSGLTSENKRTLHRYFKTIYPRDYVQKLLAAIDDNLQSEKNSSDQNSIQ